MQSHTVLLELLASSLTYLWVCDFCIVTSSSAAQVSKHMNNVHMYHWLQKAAFWLESQWACWQWYCLSALRNSTLWQLLCGAAGWVPKSGGNIAAWYFDSTCPGVDKPWKHQWWCLQSSQRFVTVADSEPLRGLLVGSSHAYGLEYTSADYKHVSVLMPCCWLRHMSNQSQAEFAI